MVWQKVVLVIDPERPRCVTACEGDCPDVTGMLSFEPEYNWIPLGSWIIDKLFIVESGCQPKMNESLSSGPTASQK